MTLSCFQISNNLIRCRIEKIDTISVFILKNNNDIELFSNFI